LPGRSTFLSGQHSAVSDQQTPGAGGVLADGWALNADIFFSGTWPSGKASVCKTFVMGSLAYGLGMQ
jgi:hypothetical protein